MVVLTSEPENVQQFSNPAVTKRLAKKNVKLTDENDSKTEAKPSGPTVKASKPAKKRSKRSNSKPSDSSADEKKKLGKTPYQGDSKTCGMFHCNDCKKEWFSAHSWADTYQTCKDCNAQIYPYKQFRPRKGYGEKKEIPHHTDKCQMCMRLGHSCANSYFKKGIMSQNENGAFAKREKKPKTLLDSLVREE